MSRVIAAYDLDEDHGRLWVNADLKRMPEFVIVANQPTDRAQTVTYVPETRMFEAMDAAREAGHRANMAERVAADHKGLCDSLRETNDDLRRIIDEMKDTERLADENAKLRELAQRMWRLERFGCYGCRRECDAKSCYASDCKEAVEIEQEMRKLGIEVPQ